jgi:hypothetical protein
MNRSILLAGALAAGLFAATSAVQAQTNEPWCGVDDRVQATECVYRTLEACEKTVRGEGGYCQPNPAGGRETTGDRTGLKQNFHPTVDAPKN